MISTIKGTANGFCDERKPAMMSVKENALKELNGMLQTVNDIDCNEELASNWNESCGVCGTLPQKYKPFFDAAGNIDIDGDAVDELRKESMRFDNRRDYPALHKDEKEKLSEE